MDVDGSDGSAESERENPSGARGNQGLEAMEKQRKTKEKNLLFSSWPWLVRNWTLAGSGDPKCVAAAV